MRVAPRADHDVRLIGLLRVEADGAAVLGELDRLGRARLPGLDRAEQLLELLDDVVADLAAEPDDGALRVVPAVEVAEERVARRRADGVLRADDVPAERLVAVQVALPDVADVAPRRVGVHVHLLDDHALLALDLVGVEARVAEHVDEDVERDIPGLRSALDVVPGELLARERVELAADRVDLRRDDARRRPPLGALEEHVLGEVRDAALVAALVPRTGGEHHEARHRLCVRHGGGEHARAVREGRAIEGRHGVMLAGPGGPAPTTPSSSSRSRAGARPTPSTSSASASVAATVSSSGAKRQAGADGPSDVDLEETPPLVVAGVDPERELHPLADLVLGEERVVDLDRARRRAGDPPRGVDHGAHRRRPGRVERPREPLLGRRHDPVREVTDVDELHRPPGRARARARRRPARSGAAST